MKFKLLLIRFFLIASAFYLVSCDKDDPMEPNPSGDARDKFVAQWTCQEESKNTGNSTFLVTITKSTISSDQILIENLYNIATIKPYAVVSGNNFTIPLQIASGNYVKGSGTWMSTNQLKLSYTVNNGASTDSCKATFTK